MRGKGSFVFTPPYGAQSNSQYACINPDVSLFCFPILGILPNQGMHIASTLSYYACVFTDRNQTH